MWFPLLPLALLLCLPACGGGTVDARDVRVDGEPLDQVLLRVEKQAAQAGITAAEAKGGGDADPSGREAGLSRLEPRLSDLELALATLEQHMLEQGDSSPNASGRQELLENIINEFL